MGSTRPITADDDFPDVLSLPQLDLESSDADEVSSDEEEDASDAGPGEEGEDVLDELAAEALLEQQLAEEADGSSVNDPVAPASGSMPRASALAKPGSLIHADDKARLLGFDARDYKDRRRIVSSAITGQPHSVWDSIEPGYGSESGEDEPENRVGSIPSHFYDDLPHIGYDVDGKRVMRPARGDALDKFLATVDADGEGWTSVYDKLAGKDVALTDEELDLIHRLARSENPDPEYDPYADSIDVFVTSENQMVMPLNARPEPKRRFVPSKWEHKKVMKIVRAIRAGRIVPTKPSVAPKPQFYELWSDADAPREAGPMHMPAPKLAPPTHAESYNPPAEYLFTAEERREWDEAEPEDRKIGFVPAKHSALRRVPGYTDFVHERFQRCLDLYLAPRTRRRRPRLDIDDPEQLAPKLPSPSELRPFPTTCSATYPHPTGVKIRGLSIDADGVWLLTGADDGQARLWELRVGRMATAWALGDAIDGEVSPVFDVAWAPEAVGSAYFAAASQGKVSIAAALDLLSPARAAAAKSQAFAAFEAAKQPNAPAPLPDVRWSKPASGSARERGVLLNVEVPGIVRQVVWHRAGDYFATVATNAGSHGVLVHQLSRHQTQAPFKRTKGDVQQVAFHPSRSHLFVATQRTIRVYDLVGQTLIQTLQPGVKWISSIDIHPQGENLIVGSYDRRTVWHDLELGERPFKTLRHHDRAVRTARFSPRWPLFATAGDDGALHVFHATVSSDLATDPVIVPVRVLRAHAVADGIGALIVQWHPREPWVVSAGADGMAKLWTD